jgi:integrase
MKIAGRKITVRAARANGRRVWVVDRQELGKRKRSFHESKAAAEAAAAEIRAQKHAMGEAWLTLSVQDRNRLMVVWNKAVERGIDLEALVDGAEAVPTTKITLGVAIEKLLDHGRQGARSKRYLYQLGNALGRFAEGRESVKLTSIEPADVASWLSGHSQWTRATYRQRLSALFRFAVHQGWLDRNPVVRVASVRIVTKTPTILSAPQHVAALRSLLRRPRGLAWYVLSCLCGLRPEEAARTEWKNILLDADTPLIRVEAQTSKIRQRRIVYPHPTAVAWLRFARETKKGELPLGSEPRRAVIIALRKAVGFAKWPQDVTRHTAASYWLAERQDASALAESLGHSVDVLKRHYRAVVTREEASRFWSITPELVLGGDNVITPDFASSDCQTSGDHPTRDQGDCPNAVKP